MRKSLLIILLTLSWAGIARAQASYGVPSSGIGRCSSGMVVSALNPNAPPTCVSGSSAAGPINTLPAQTGNYSANSHKITGLAAPTTTGDALSQGAAASVTNLTTSGTNSLTDTSGNGSSQTFGLCIDGICSGTAFGMKVANSDNSTDLQAAINAAYESGTSSATKGKVLITPDATGGTTYTFTSGVDFKEVPVECQASRTIAASAGLANITLHFTQTSGVAIVNAGSFKNCAITGAFVPGNGLSNSISSITDGTNNQATVVTTATNTVIQGSTVVISGTTNFNGVFPVASVTNGTTFVIDLGNPGIATENAGTINYFPTVGIAAHHPGSATLSCCSVDWQNLYVSGFGTLYDISTNQSGAGSTDDWEVSNIFGGSGIVGLLANGNGFPDNGTTNANVAGGRFGGPSTFSNVSIAVYGGPLISRTANNPDPEESSFGNNELSKIDFEVPNQHSSDSPYVAGIWVGGYGNWIHDNYLASVNAGGSQTAKGAIRTTDGIGPNYITNNRINSVSASGLVVNATDEAVLNIPGVSANQSVGRALVSGISIAAYGQTPRPMAAACKGTCATAGSGGTVNSYALVGIGWDGNKSTASPQFICPDGSYVNSGSSCAAGVAGPDPYSGSNFVNICWNPDPNFKAYDILINDTTHSTHLAFASGTNGNNCYADTTGSSTSYTALANDTTGGINETNTHATNVLGAQIHMAPVAVASLPATCTAGDSIPVTNWNGTNGTCTGGGTDYTMATCGASNTWYCP